VCTLPLQTKCLCFLSLQTAWRGHQVRATHPRCKQLADIRERLAAATANAGKRPCVAALIFVASQYNCQTCFLPSGRQTQALPMHPCPALCCSPCATPLLGLAHPSTPGCSAGQQAPSHGRAFRAASCEGSAPLAIGALHQHPCRATPACKAATAKFSPCLHCSLQAVSALNGLALCTDAVLACADIVVAGGGLPALLGIVQSCGRSKEAAEALRAALQCLSNICRSK